MTHFVKRNTHNSILSSIPFAKNSPIKYFINNILTTNLRGKQMYRLVLDLFIDCF